MRLEVEVVAELLFDAEKIKTVEVNPNWFKDKNLRYIVEYLRETEGEEDDYILMAENIKKKHPDSDITDEMMIDLASSSATNARLEKHLKELNVKHHEEKLAYYSREFGKNPSKKHYNKMRLAIVELEEVRDKQEEFGLRGAVDELYYELEHGMKSGVRTYEGVSDILGDGFSGGMLVTIGARPSIGKTTFGINLNMEGMENHDDLMSDFFTLEMTKKEMLKKFVSRMTEINSYKFVNTKLQLNEQEKAKVVASAEWLAQQDLMIIDDQFHFEEIIRTIRRRKAETKGKYIAFIDYLQLIKGNNVNNRYLEIGEITRELKKTANQLDIPIVIFSQLSRGIESRQDKTPVLADLRESGDIEQDSSVVMFLHRDEDEDEDNRKVDENITQLTVAKNRNGATAQIPFRFYKTRSTFEEVRR